MEKQFDLNKVYTEKELASADGALQRTSGEMEETTH